MSDTEAIISVKNDLGPAASGSSNLQKQAMLSFAARHLSLVLVCLYVSFPKKGAKNN